MYTTEIEINGNKVQVRFGAYVIKCLADEGIALQELGEKIKTNPADVIPKIIFYAIQNASPDWKGFGVTLKDVYDWIDEDGRGLFSDEVIEITNLFAKQLTDNLPKNLKAGKASPQK